MRTIAHKNRAAAEPLTPLNAEEAVRYRYCNLTNRLVHPGSILEHCQTAQVVRDGDDAHPVGPGVRGEVTAAMVQAVRDRIEASS